MVQQHEDKNYQVILIWYYFKMRDFNKMKQY